MPAQTVHLHGVPLDLGGNHRGVDMGPSAVRIAGLAERLSQLGCQVVDRGNVPVPIPETQMPRYPQKKYIRDIARACQKLYHRVYRSHTEGALPIVVGGDHSLAAGSVAASADFAAATHGQIGLVWVDAHGDLNTPETTTSGNVHGMPLAALLGDEPAELARIGVRSPEVAANRTVLVGLRDLDPPERDRIKRSGVTAFTMKDVDRHGIATVMEKALAIATRNTFGIHLSFDLDVCDPSIAPGVGTPVKGGIDWREANLLMEAVADSRRMVSCEVTELNPILDVRNQSGEVAIDVISSAFGKRIL